MAIIVVHDVAPNAIIKANTSKTTLFSILLNDAIKNSFNFNLLSSFG